MCVPLEINEILFLEEKNHGIPRNCVQLCDTEFRVILRNFRQFCTIWSTKNRRNSVSTEFRGHSISVGIL
jgi:hypothetical protein